MLQRIGAVEPGIEHAVREDEVRRLASVERPPDAEAAVIPEAMDDHRIILRAPLRDPPPEAGRVTVAAAARPQSMHRDGALVNPRVGRRVERNDLDRVTPRNERSRRLLDRLNRPANRRIN